MAPGKLGQALALMQQGCDLKILTDSVQSASAIASYGRAHGVTFQVLIEIDTDDHRSGIKPESAELLDVARVLATPGSRIAGVLTHAGSSYDLNTAEALQAMAETERSGCVRAAERLRAAGFTCDMVSVGSTPTALSAKHEEGVTEIRAGVYVFFDLVMHNVGVCELSDIALSVLTTVIVDAGWMAMSRDRGTQRQANDFGYGQVCDAHGAPIHGYTISGANQEHGIVSRIGEPDPDIAERFPVGTVLRVLPNHACATGAQFPEYQAISSDGTVTAWPRFYGW